MLVCGAINVSRKFFLAENSNGMQRRRKWKGISSSIKTNSRCREKLTVAKCQTDGTVGEDQEVLDGFLRLEIEIKDFRMDVKESCREGNQCLKFLSLLYEN